MPKETKRSEHEAKKQVEQISKQSFLSSIAHNNA